MAALAIPDRGTGIGASQARIRHQFYYCPEPTSWDVRPLHHTQHRQPTRTAFLIEHREQRAFERDTTDTADSAGSTSIARLLENFACGIGER